MLEGRLYVMYRNIKKYSILSSFKHTAMIVVPSEVNVIVQNNCVFVTGILGTLTYTLHALITVQIDDKKNILLYTKNKSSINKALIGTTKALIYGMVIGVAKGFVKKLQLIGIGYRASIVNGMINLIIGFSHSVNYRLPVEIKATCINQTEIVLTSINKQLIGQVAADLRSIRPPEPFKGKGIRYINEVVRNKDTKKR